MVDSARLVAGILLDVLENNNSLNDSGHAKDQFFLSDYTDYFEKIARMFFEGDINLVKADIWN